MYFVHFILIGDLSIFHFEFPYRITKEFTDADDDDAAADDDDNDDDDDTHV